ncbi:MAG: carbamoyl-phosphate synthase large subunit, partial [Thiohalocapsa sp.]
READSRLTTQMKSVGEVMAIGRTFQESLQKALRGLETDRDGLNRVVNPGESKAEDVLRREIRQPGPDRIFYIADAMRLGWGLEEIQSLSGIDPWFLAQIEELVALEAEVKTAGAEALGAARLRLLKRKGFSDKRLAKLVGSDEASIRRLRHGHGIRPVFKRVDTCAAEFATATAYMYSTYDEECEAAPTDRQKIMVLGGGPNRIGQGIEFDYCCVHAALALREDGFETIMVNCNPETVSTDYDTSDRLYFEPLTLEDVLEIVQVEQPFGVIVQYGGQTPLKLARDLEAAGVPIIGTSPDSIDLAEDRERFQRLVHQLDLKQPPNATARSESEALEQAAAIGYPLVVRPSYVLGGRAMELVYDDLELARYIRSAVSVSNEAPVLLDRFLDNAIEVDVDAVCDGERVLIGGIMEHIEQAGVHSGDSACSLPPYTLTDAAQQRLREQMTQLGLALGVRGLMNAQFAIQDDEIYILEVNPRASRTVPFVSKSIGVPLAKVGARCMAGTDLAAQGLEHVVTPPRYFVKEAVFPFVKFPGVDTVLGPEMKSTGEVMGIGDSFAEAFGKAVEGAGMSLPKRGKAMLSVRSADRARVVEVARALERLGFELYGTHGTARAVREAGMACTGVNKVKEGRPHIVDMIKNDEIVFIVNTTEGTQAIADSAEIRRAALQHKVSYTTTIAGAEATCMALQQGDLLDVNPLQALY